MIPRAPGTYLLLLALAEPAELPIGRTRRMQFDAGLYCYAGSALGPGGLAARLGRYASGQGRHHWHIDYLLPHATLLGALVVEDTRRLECRWAGWVDDRAQACVAGFGSSDCGCRGHLFRIGLAQDSNLFIASAELDLHARWISLEQKPGSVVNRCE